MNLGSAKQLRGPMLWMARKLFPKISAFPDVKRLARLHHIEPRPGEDIIAVGNPAWNSGDGIDTEKVPLAGSALPPMHGRLG
jgi:hypothetical protein